MVAVLLVVPLGQSLAWKRGDLLGAAQRLIAAVAVGAVSGALLLAFRHGGPTLAPLGVAVAAYVVVGAFTEVADAAACRVCPSQQRCRVSPVFRVPSGERPSHMRGSD